MSVLFRFSNDSVVVISSSISRYVDSSERTTSIGRFSPLFYGKKDQQLPFTDSDGLYDFPSSDGKNYNTTHHSKKSSMKRKERKSSRAGK